MKNNEALTDTGLPAVGRVPWGSHFSIFYETKNDLLDILVPYFKAGLEQNELCLWIVGGHEFVTMKAAKEALAKGIPELEDFLKKGNIQILTHKQLFGTRGRQDPDTAIARVRRKTHLSNRPEQCGRNSRRCAIAPIRGNRAKRRLAAG